MSASVDLYPGYQGTAPSTRTVFPVVVLLLLSATLLQKFASPGTANAQPISLLLMPLLLLYAWSRNLVFVERNLLISVSLFVVATLLSTILNMDAETISFPALCLVLLLHSQLIFRPTDNVDIYVRSICFFRDLMFFLSIVGILQFYGQYVVGTNIAFFLDYQIPKSIYLQFYNALNPLKYGSEIYKSTGVVFAEPSIFSQFVAIGAIIEFSTRRRLLRLAIFAAALLTAYSGTGFIVIIVFGVYWLIKNRRPSYMIAGSVVGVLAVVGVVFFAGDLITSRISEFGTPNSSGHARFVSIFFMIDHFIMNDWQAAFFGRGPGTLVTYYAKAPFGAFDPTWGKVVFEYGLVGTAIYVVLLTQLYSGAPKAIAYPLLANYLLSGGYLNNPCLLTLTIVLVSWSTQRQETDALDEPSSNGARSA